jgi:hypothetical protein
VSKAKEVGLYSDAREGEIEVLKAAKRGEYIPGGYAEQGGEIQSGDETL